MYAIEKGMKKVNGRELVTFARLLAEPQTAVAVEAGTTGYTGVESREGGGQGLTQEALWSSDLAAASGRKEGVPKTGELHLHRWRRGREMHIQTAGT